MEEFKLYLIDKELSPLTITRHLRYLEKVTKECPNLTLSEVSAFFVKLKEKGCKNSYLNHITSTMRLYGAFKNLPELLALKYRKEEPFIKATLSDEEIELLVNMECPKNWARVNFERWQTFFAIMAYSGMRPSEVARLDHSCIDISKKCFLIKHSKTQGGITLLPIAPNILERLNNYMKSISSDLLFPSLKGLGVVDQSDWHSNFVKRLKYLGIFKKGLSAYSLRHSFCTSLIDHDVNLFYTKRMMRHADLHTTERYFHWSIKSLAEQLNKLPAIRKSTTPKSILSSLVDLVKSFKIEEDNRFSYRLEENENSMKFEVYIK